MLAFAARIRSGIFTHDGKRPGTQTVATTVRHVRPAFVLAGYTDPQTDSHTWSLHLTFTRMYSGYKHALPISVFEDIMRHEGCSPVPREQALTNLIGMTFFFLICVGEYTPASCKRKTRTVPLRVKDIQFWAERPDGSVSGISHTAPAHNIMPVSAVTITLDNQKTATGTRSSTIMRSS
jgi:hypothetical protein